MRRASVEDIRAMRREIALWRPRMQYDPNIVADLDRGDAFARLLLGDVEGARAELLRVWSATPREHGPQRIAGRVVDAAGRPVAGATVYASALLVTAGSGILPNAPADVLAATSDADGRFTISDGPRTGAVLAIAGTLRSPPAAPGEDLRLVVNPTRTISGRIELGRIPYTKVVAVAASAGLPTTYNAIAPVAPDGTFAIAGAPIEAARVAAVIGFGRTSTAVAAELDLPASLAPQRDVVLSLASGDRTVYVIVRSTLTTPLSAALAALERGIRPRESTFADALRRGMPARKDFASAPRDAPPEVLARTRPGDLVATFEHAPDELLSACAMALPPNWQRYERYAPAFELRCVPLPREASIVIVETPPQRRFD